MIVSCDRWGLWNGLRLKAISDFSVGTLKDWILLQEAILLYYIPP